MRGAAPFFRILEWLSSHLARDTSYLHVTGLAAIEHKVDVDSIAIVMENSEYGYASCPAHLWNSLSYFIPAKHGKALLLDSCTLCLWSTRGESFEGIKLPSNKAMPASSWNPSGSCDFKMANQVKHKPFVKPNRNWTYMDRYRWMYITIICIYI